MISESNRQLRAVGVLTRERVQSRFVPSLYAIALVTVLGAILISALSPRLDTDLWWHLKVGAYIAAHHSVPSRDFLSYTFLGHRWTDHEWLAETLMYELFRGAGLWGIIALFAAVICAAFSLVYGQMLQNGVHRIFGLFVVCPAFFASSGSWGPRIQMISLLFVALFAFLLRRFSVTRDRRLLVAFPVIMLVWANLHGGFVLGLVVFGVWYAGEIANSLTLQEDALSIDDLRALGIALIVTLGVTVINPNGIRQLLYPLAFILPNHYTNQIQESASPDFHQPLMMIFEALLLSLIASVFIARPRINWIHLFLVLVFTHLALSQVRNVALWTVVVSPILALYLQQAAGTIRGYLPAVGRKSRTAVSSRLVPVLNLTFLLIVVLVYGAAVYRFITPASLQAAETGSFPRGAVAYMRTHHLPAHVFTSYSWGGYLIWNLYPLYRPFMDSRADTLYDNTMLSAYLTAHDGGPRWKSVLNRYAVGDVLVERGAPLSALLAQDHAWRVDYQDKISVLYVRR